MAHKMLIGLGVLVTSGIAASSSAFAVGAGASARANMHVPVKSLVKTVAMSPRGIRRSLRKRGYRNIRFTDRRLPVYKVRACRNGKKFRLRLNRWGDINRRVRIGWCDTSFGPRNVGLSFPEIRSRLRDRGYHRIRFTDRRLPGYGARACKNGKRFALRLNRWGRIMDRDRRGWCAYGGNYRGNHYGPRNRAGLRYDGPGFSITLKNNRY